MAHGRAWYRCRHAQTSDRDVLTDRAKTLYLREDHVLAYATAQYANLAGLDPDTLAADDLAAWLRERGITIVCTPVNITLDIGAAQTTDGTEEIIEVRAEQPAAAGVRPADAPPIAAPPAVQLPIPGCAFRSNSGGRQRETPTIVIRRK